MLTRDYREEQGGQLIFSGYKGTRKNRSTVWAREGVENSCEYYDVGIVSGVTE